MLENEQSQVMEAETDLRRAYQDLRKMAKYCEENPSTENMQYLSTGIAYLAEDIKRASGTISAAYWAYVTDEQERIARYQDELHKSLIHDVMEE